MIAKQVLRSVLLIIVLGSLAIWANREIRKSESYAETEKQPTPADTLPIAEGPQVVMTYFLIGARCASCRKIEALARETAERDFPGELASKKLIFRVINTDDATNRHYLDDYKLTSKTVVISRRLDGRQTAWMDMEKAWDLLDDPPGFHAYLGETIRKYLSP